MSLTNFSFVTLQDISPARRAPASPSLAPWERDSMANWLLLALLLDVCKSACPSLRSHLHRTMPPSAVSYSYPGRDVTKVTHPGRCPASTDSFLMTPSPVLIPQDQACIARQQRECRRADF